MRLVEFGLPFVIAYSQRNITVPRRFLQDSSSLKIMIRSTPLNCLLPSHRFQIRNSVYNGHQASIFRALEARGKHFFPPFGSKRSKQDLDCSLTRHFFENILSTDV